MASTTTIKFTTTHPSCHDPSKTFSTRFPLYLIKPTKISKHKTPIIKSAIENSSEKTTPLLCKKPAILYAGKKIANGIAMIFPIRYDLFVTERYVIHITAHIIKNTFNTCFFS